MTAPSKIVVIVGCMTGNIVSGGDVAAFTWSRYWSEMGVDVKVLTSPEGKSSAQEVGFGGQVESVGSYERLPVPVVYAIRAIALSWRIVKLLRRRGRDTLVVSSSPFPPDVLPALVARVFGSRWALSWQAPIPRPWIRYEDANNPVPKRSIPRLGQSASYLAERFALMRFMHSGSALLVSNSQLRRSAIARGIDEGLIIQHGHGAPLAASKPGLEKHFDGVFLSRFQQLKGVADLPKIWKLVLDEIPGAKLAVIGGTLDDLRPEVVTEFRALPEGSVTFFGVKTGNEKYELLGQSKLFLFPSRFESFGYVVLEALASGLPVVAHDMSTLREAFGDALTYVSLGDTRGFAAAVAELLMNPVCLKQSSEEALKVARTYDWTAITSEILQRLSASL